MARSYKWVLGSVIGLLIVAAWTALIMGVSVDQGPELSSSEKHHMLERYNPLIVAVHPMPALSIQGEKNHTGLVAAYLDLIGAALDIEVSVKSYASFDAAYDAVQNGAAHMTALMPAPPEPNLLRLSHAMTVVPLVIVTKADNTTIRSIDDLDEKRVLTPDDEPYTRDYLYADYPNIIVNASPDVNSAFTAVSTGEADAVILDKAAASHALRAGEFQLKIASALDRPFKAVFVLPGDAPQLETIINKTIASLDPQDRDSIRRQWLDPAGIPKVDQSDLLLNIILAMLALMIPVAMILSWNRALRTTVEYKTLALREELSRRRAAEAELQQHKEDLEIAVANRTRELHALELILREINKKMWLEDLIHLILDQAMILFPQAEKGGFLLKSDTSDDFVFKALEGYPESMAAGVTLSKSEAVHRYTGGDNKLEEGVFLVKHIDGMAGDQQLSNFPVPMAMLAMSLMIGDELVGFLILDHLNDANAFAHQDVEQLARFREHAISAIARSRLLQKFKDLTDELESKNRQLEEASQRLELLSTTDALTKLKNRRYLQQTLDVDIARSLRSYGTFAKNPETGPPTDADISFLLMDLDHFKFVNDTYGHDAGDRVLVQVSQIMLDISRDTDTVIRWGGEEFLIVARAARGKSIAVLVERLRTAVAEHDFDLGNGQILRRTCSIGYATFPFLIGSPEALSWEGVVNIADKALYVAKKSSRNAWVGIAPKAALRPERLQSGDLNLAELVDGELVEVETSVTKPLVFLSQDAN